MIQKIVDAFINKQLENQEMKAEDKNIYRYGYILLGEVILNSVTAFVIGIVFSEITAVIFFLCLYIPLRSFSGGWHADKIWKCTLISNAILLLQVYSIKNVLQHLPAEGMLVVLLVNIVCVFFIAPVETQMKKINEREKHIYKRKINIIIVIHLITAMVMTLLIAKEFLFSIMFVYMIQNVMLLLEVIRQKAPFFAK